MKLHTHTQGQGPLLILLHGWGFGSLVWQDLLTPLSTQYTVKCIDLPGYGSSPFDDEIHSLKDICDAILNEVDEAAIYMGWSLGGLVAQYLAIHYPERINQLICVTSSPCFVKKTNWPGISPSLLKLFSTELVNNYQELLEKFLALQFFGMKVDRALLKNLKQQLTQEHPNQRALHLGLELLLESDLRVELSKIQCPTHYIFGKLDVIVPASQSEPLALLLPQAKMTVVKGAGHAPFISHPSVFLESTGLLK